MAPIDAAASPLPREETTPPVTKMYLVLVICLRSWCGEQAPHVLKILGRIHAQRIVFRLDSLDADAVFERAQLFEAFRALERCGLERGQHQQRASPIRVQADVAEHLGPRPALVAGVGDRRA